MQVLFHTREEVMRRLRRLTEDLLILPHTLRHLLLDVLLTSDRSRKALSLHSGHGGRALGGHTSLADGFADARRGSSDLSYMPCHRVVLPERLLELSQAGIKRRLHLAAPVQLPLVPLEQLHKLCRTLDGPPISFVNHCLGRPSRLPGAVDNCLSHLSTKLSHFGREVVDYGRQGRRHLVHRESCSLVHLAHEAL